MDRRSGDHGPHRHDQEHGPATTGGEAAPPQHPDHGEGEEKDRKLEGDAEDEEKAQCKREVIVTADRGFESVAAEIDQEAESAFERPVAEADAAEEEHGEGEDDGDDESLFPS